jgi:ankyrin repeat protein
MVGTSKMTPLHITCSSQHASVQVVQVLLAGGIEIQSSLRDVDGDTPLHAACRCGAPIEVLELLLRANPSAVHERDYEGLTPLLRLWVRYFVILGKDAIDSVEGRDDLKGELGEAWNKTELLLRAAYHGSLEASIAYQGKPMTFTSPGGPNSVFRAVHAAASVDCPRQVIKIATKVYPEQLEQVDEESRIPLIIATMSPTWKIRDLSDEGYLLEDRIHDGHVERESDNMDDAEQVGPNSLYPSVIEILVTVAPEAAKRRDTDGRLPLQLAIANGKKWTTGVKALLEAYPEAMVFHDPLTNLLPFMLAATVKKGGCTTIFQLLRSNPSLL